jgi:hypothetical protein
LKKWGFKGKTIGDGDNVFGLTLQELQLKKDEETKNGTSQKGNTYLMEIINNNLGIPLNVRWNISIEKPN